MYELRVFIHEVIKTPEMIHFHRDLSDAVGACCVLSI